MDDLCVASSSLHLFVVTFDHFNLVLNPLLPLCLISGLHQHLSLCVFNVVSALLWSKEITLIMGIRVMLMWSLY